MSTKSTRRVVAPATALVSALLVTSLLLSGCSGDGSGSVRVAAPAPTGSAAAQCAALQQALPRTLQGRARREVTPATGTTAAWGDPAITLRCGVGLPGVMDPNSSGYDPLGQNSAALDVNGLCWVSEQTSGGGYRFTTVKQQAFVEVDVPGAYHGQESPLSALTGPVLKTDPADVSRRFDCS
ncbi:DUF3515 family protein [Streptacidiphilus sp. EB129]|uniref:DUF3515 family protein n=1 Tax=Streptacidiphilus sp. EB129 TaxID=3156262 RepID=UPI0035178698